MDTGFGATETPKRALALAGGGPACGLQIGALQKFADAGFKFDVWALSCIGAWVGIVYNQFDPEEAPKATERFFRDHVFRDDRSYSRFPINHVFAPDLGTNLSALYTFLANPKTYENLYLPGAMFKAVQANLAFLANPGRWNASEFNLLALENMAAHPLSRFLTSLIYLTEVDGLSRIYYPDSPLLRAIDFDALKLSDRPFMYHNAWNLSRQRLDLFSNRPRRGYFDISPASLCACSALPYIQETVKLNGDTYCEGALVDTVNFKQLLDDHPELDEIWVVRIVTQSQIRAPKTLADALGNLCMLFAASVGEDDIKLFRFHAKERNWKGKIIEIPVSSAIDFEWNDSNLDAGIREGYRATRWRIEEYEMQEQPNPATRV